MYLSRLFPDTTSHDFRRDHADLHHMHRTIMSGFPDVTGNTPARTHHGVLWRLDRTRHGHTLYVQSHTRPDWSHLDHYLTRPADTRDLSEIVETLQPGRTLAFRLTANPTKRLRLTDQRDPNCTGGRRDNRYPIVKPEAQISWLINQANRHGFIIPTGSDTQPDVATTSAPRQTGKQHDRGNTVSVDQVHYDGHLVITDRTTFTTALFTGIGPSKAYGCGLLTLAPAQR
ncbi:type I-E CRISPR-associated protein Cas6/Cse3/CasE [Saccharopolyspora cebuensis]|uniref:Type I-E CRISPR-associated protein Cas6/Cse3/CasE n=1 Tax=Saccharopolyspora cebuensis TaxID=418759 RepID=A0ABV4CG47_9PSEU